MPVFAQQGLDIQFISHSVPALDRGGLTRRISCTCMMDLRLILDRPLHKIVPPCCRLCHSFIFNQPAHSHALSAAATTVSVTQVLV